MESIKKGYICSPLNAKTEKGIRKNMKKARVFSKITSIILGYKCLATHGILPKYFNDNIESERNLCLKFGLNYLEICDSLIICSKNITSGMKGEINLAKSLGKEIYYIEGFVTPFYIINIFLFKLKILKITKEGVCHEDKGQAKEDFIPKGCLCSRSL